MLIKKAADIRSSEITPKSVYLAAGSSSRRRRPRWSRPAAGRWPASAAAQARPAKLPNSRRARSARPKRSTSTTHVTSYNNFYEFGTGKGDRPKNARGTSRPRRGHRGRGLVAKPGKYDLEDFIKPYALEERIYRMRCVEAWSMVIPWVGIPLEDVIKRVQPTGKAQFVEFMTLHDVGRMPMQRTDVLDWPYVEGLRLDEAKHPLAMLAVGHVRRGAAGAERCADPSGRAMEVRLQGRQVDRQDALRGEAAA